MKYIYIYIYIKRRHQKSDPKVCRKHTRTAKRHNQEKEGLKEHVKIMPKLGL